MKKIFNGPDPRTIDSWANKTKLTDLNDDCLLLILEELNLSSLLSLSQISKGFCTMAAYVYQQKFDHKILRINQLTTNQKVDILENEIFGCIEVEEIDVIRKLFKSFGTVISNVEITIYKNDRKIEKNTKDIINFISKNSLGLKDLTLLVYDEYPFQSVNHAFTNVENLTLVGPYSNLASKTLQLNEMFPNLRRLDIENARIINQKCIKLPFNYLKHLQLNLLYFNESNVKQIINMNQEIQSLTVYQISMEFLQFLSINLPNLEYLEFTSSRYPSYNGKIHFENVKYLKIWSTIEEFVRNVSFTKLLKLNLCDHDYNDFPYAWIDFIGRNDQLKSVKVHTWALNDNQVKSLKVPSLVNAFFALKPDVETNTIIEFFKKNQNLKKFGINYVDYDDIIDVKMELLKSQIENEWTFTETRGWYLLERD